MFKEGPAGEGIIFIAEDGGRIVGHDADIPVLMKMGNRNVTGRLGFIPCLPKKRLHFGSFYA